MGRDAELSDILHDTFVQAYASIHRLQDTGALKGWLSSVAIFTARGVIRKRKVRRWLSFSAPEDLPEAPSSSSDPSSRHALLRVYAILETLPTDDRIAFALRFVEGMELSEIGAQCRCSLATVKRRIARAEEKFLEAARDDPALCQRIEGGRWANP
jgi:RNA polymerase sigma-70 factor (ECF subfamily)